MVGWKARGLVVAVALVAGGVIGSTPTQANAHRRGCFPLRGGFEAVPAPPEECASPVGFCTRGTLTGSLRGTYAFTMTGALPSPGTPGVNTFVGESVVSTRRGATWTGIDDGVIDLDPNRFGYIASLITFTEGTGWLSGATGQIHIRGNVNFETGGSSGNYVGRVCYDDPPRRDDDDDDDDDD